MTIHDSFYTNEFRAVTGFYRAGEADLQAEFIEKTVPLVKGHMILDLACGFGRHAIPLARKGYSVTGYDQSEDYIATAREEAERAGVAIAFQRMDMRSLDECEAFDVILSMSTALAFYSDEVNFDILRRVYRALKPGGRFLFDQANVFRIARMFGEGRMDGTHTLPDGRTHRMRTTFDAETCVASRRSSLDGEESGWDIRYYTLPEFRTLTAGFGFRFLRVHGDYDDSPYRAESERMIALLGKE
jgi:2-polyprenyl-3-methyl-5-hydroxy-6-metoxy-1,4-benzoquinol methylase